MLRFSFTPAPSDVASGSITLTTVLACISMSPSRTIPRYRQLHGDNRAARFFAHSKADSLGDAGILRQGGRVRPGGKAVLKRKLLACATLDVIQSSQANSLRYKSGHYRSVADLAPVSRCG